MKKTLWIILAVITISAFTIYNVTKKDEVPITKCIGLDPVLDKVRDRFNRDTVRNLVYINEALDPDFYASLVSKIEACSWTKDQQLLKQSNVHGDLFGLEGSAYSPDNLHDKVAFVAPDSMFDCVVYDGSDYVVVVLTARY